MSVNKDVTGKSNSLLPVQRQAIGEVYRKLDSWAILSPP